MGLDWEHCICSVPRMTICAWHARLVGGLGAASAYLTRASWYSALLQLGHHVVAAVTVRHAAPAAGAVVSVPVSVVFALAAIGSQAYSTYAALSYPVRDKVTLAD